MRKTCLEMVHKLAQRDPRVVFIGSDLSPGLLGGMKAEMPHRHYMEGVTEANVVGMAAGMAMDGLLPYVNTIATFITRRCYEQVAVDLCLHDLPVRLIGNGGGFVYAPLGPTHLAVEDIAIMRALPNMTVTAVADADEMVRLMNATLDWPHPIYVRLGKGGDPIVSSDVHEFAIGRGIVMRPAIQTSGYVLLVSTGVMTGRALQAADSLAATGIDVEVMHLHTLKPLDAPLVLARALGAQCVCTVEEHSVIGGLGSAIADVLVEARLPRLPRVLRLGIPDRFVAHYGVQDELLEHYQLQPVHIADAIEAALSQNEAAQ